ncbi:MAG: sugar phosphate nucleotidyltransferase [Propionibacteriaceae bacterium]|nr:sugar phosphate nucleotidyltransferase [Propionibacteriaceae bacterium]
MRIPRTLALVLAGGQGSRLGCLTDARPKPTLPMGGTYRLIDIALSNLAHSHISHVGLVQQYLPHPLNEYVSGGRPWDLDRNHGGLLALPPFQGGHGEGFAEGNADALHRQREIIAAHDPEIVLVMSADHLYTMNFLDAITTHLDRDADLTIVTTQVDESAARYGVVTTDNAGSVTGFEYKPDEPTSNLVTTEVFLYRTQALLEALDTLHAEHGDLGDYGDHLVPWFVDHHTVVEHRHTTYWMDVGTIQSYWTANMQLVDGNGVSLDHPAWPIYSAQPQLSPARVEAGASVQESLLSTGCTVAGTVERSIIGTGAVVAAGASVERSVLLDGARVGPGATLVNCIVDAGAEVTGGSQRGSTDAITVIGADGLVAQREALDPDAVLPETP